jgi:hypothetical protein
MTYSELKKTSQWDTVLQYRRGLNSAGAELSFSERGGDLVDSMYLSSLMENSISMASILEGSRREEEAQSMVNG